MKLFSVSVMDDCESTNVLVIAKDTNEAEEKVSKMDWSCCMGVWAYEVEEIDGYKIVFKKGKKISLE